MGKTGRRIWYVIAIIISCAVLLLSAVGIIGIWVTESALSNTVVQLIESVGKVTDNLRLAIQGVDQKLERMETISTSISTASNTISQNVNDTGLIPLLLPEDQEQKLTALSSSIKGAISSFRDTLSAGLALYQSINSIPFVSLPGPSQEQVDKLTAVVDEIESAVDKVQAAITAFRAGAKDQISKITEAADLLTSKLGQARGIIAEVDTRLTSVQETLPKLQKILINLLVIVAVLGTLFLLWVFYSQVELLRMYSLRWKSTRSITGGDDALKIPSETVEKNDTVLNSSASDIMDDGNTSI